MSNLRNVVSSINTKLEKKCKLEVGKIINHHDGRKIKVVDGAFLRNGRVSNLWSWREVLDNGSFGEIEHGYGW